MYRKVFLALLLSLCLLLPAVAQTQPAPAKPSDDQDDVVRITTNLVQVDAVVLKDGKQVTDLTAGDFEIYEDGKKQTITSFAYVSNVPRTAAEPTPAVKSKSSDVVPVSPLRPEEPRRTIALVVDDLGISAESMGQVRSQLRKFVNQEMQPNDLVAIVRTGRQLGVLQQFTNDKRILNRAVDQLRWNYRITEDTGTRRFVQNSNLDFAFVTYNATNAKPLVMQARLFRDGKNVYSGAEIPIEAGNQPDPNRLLVNGSVKLTPDLDAGNYFLQIVIFERDEKKKVPLVVQWVDFEIEN